MPNPPDRNERMAFVAEKLQATDGRDIPLYRWTQESGRPRAVVQILHGLGEHAQRYARFANDLLQHGIHCTAHDHRGHGRSRHPGHYADQNGWDKVIGDVQAVQQRIVYDAPGVPLVLLGHSMGSYIAQSFALRYGGQQCALILSGSTFASRGTLLSGHLAARALSVLRGAGQVSAFLNHAGLGKLNDKFEPARTPYDWLSRDEAEVDRYIGDPFCGGEFSNQLWADLSGGMLEISSATAIARICPQLPVLILGGAEDPIGGETGLGRLADAYRENPERDISLALYPGGRHEMLNETNRAEVTADIIAWINEKIQI